MQGLVFDIKKYAVHDGPGIRTTVYLKGCPLACAWCHNPEGQSFAPQVIVFERRCIHCGRCLEVCPAGTADSFSAECSTCGRCVAACPAGARELAGRWLGVAEVLAEIEKDVIFYDQSGGGVTFSGGEPLSRPDFLEALLLACHQRGIHTAVDTTGYAPVEVLDRISPLADLFLYDLKLMDDEAHRRYTGVSNRPVLANLQWLAAAGKPIIVRVPIVPGITDGDENLDQIGRLVLSLGGVRQVDVLPYHALAADKYGRLRLDYALAQLGPPPVERMAQIAARLKEMGIAVTIGG